MLPSCFPKTILLLPGLQANRTRPPSVQKQSFLFSYFSHTLQDLNSPTRDGTHGVFKFYSWIKALGGESSGSRTHSPDRLRVGLLYRKGSRQRRGDEPLLRLVHQRLLRRDSTQPAATAAAILNGLLRSELSRASELRYLSGYFTQGASDPGTLGATENRGSARGRKKG